MGKYDELEEITDNILDLKNRIIQAESIIYTSKQEIKKQRKKIIEICTKISGLNINENVTVIPRYHSDLPSQDRFMVLGVRFYKVKGFNYNPDTAQVIVTIVNPVNDHTLWVEDYKLGRV